MYKTKEPLAVKEGIAVTASGLIHRVWEPAAPGPHPTVVMLHGRSGNENVMWVFAKHLPPGWLVVAPRGIRNDDAGGFAWYPRARDEWPSLDKFGVAVAAVTHFIHALPSLYAADLGRMYLMGFSQGAATAYAVALQHPGLVQAIAGLLGFVPGDCEETLLAKPLKDLPVFMAAGKKDPLIPVSRTALCARALHLAGAQLDYREYETGHKLNAQAMKDLGKWWSSLLHKGEGVPAEGSGP